MNKFVLNAINKNNILAAVIASLILLLIVGVCGYFLARKWFAYKKSVEQKLEEFEEKSKEIGEIKNSQQVEKAKEEEKSKEQNLFKKDNGSLLKAVNTDTIETENKLSEDSLIDVDKPQGINMQSSNENIEESKKAEE